MLQRKMGGLAVWKALAIALTLKTALCFFLVAQLNANYPSPDGSFRLFQPTGDGPEYIRYAENLLQTGNYILDPNDEATRVHRMPGYSAFYALLRAVLAPRSALTALVLCQVVVDASAVVVLALLTQRCGAHWATLIVFALYGLSSFVSVYDFYILPDALAANVLVFAVWLIVQGASGGRRQIQIVLAGGLFTWAVFMRPFLAPVALFPVMYLWIRSRSGHTGLSPMRALLLFCLLPFLLETAWVVRNWVQLREFVPLHTAGFRLQPSENAVREWIMAFGGDFVYWRPATAAAWLNPNSVFFQPEAPPPVPESVFSPVCSRERLAMGRGAYVSLHSSTLRTEERETLAAQVLDVFESCRLDYISRAPLDHLLVARLRLLKQWVVNSGPVLPFPVHSRIGCPWSGLCWFKLGSIALYAFVVLAGLLGLSLLVWQRRPETILVAGIAAYLFFVFPFGLRMVETRYLAAAYPFLALSASVVTEWCLQALSLRSRGWWARLAPPNRL